MQLETDTARVLSGVRFGLTLGSPIALLIENRDWANWTDRMRQFAPPDAPTHFPDAPPVGALSPTIDYPLDGAVMPSTVSGSTSPCLAVAS